MEGVRTQGKHDQLTYVAELAQSKLTERSDDLPTDFIGHIELNHAHVR